MEKTFTIYLKNREDAVEIDAARVDDDGTHLKVLDDANHLVAIFVWSELQGYTVES